MQGSISTSWNDKLANIVNQSAAIGIAWIASAYNIDSEALSPLASVGAWLLMSHVVASCVSIIYHRAWTHDSIELHKIFEKVGSSVIFCLTGVWKQEWVEAHKEHHKTADKPWDPHSPKIIWLPNMLLDITYSWYGNWVMQQCRAWRILKNARLIPLPSQKFLVVWTTFAATTFVVWTISTAIIFATAYPLIKLTAWTVNWLWHNSEELKHGSYSKNVWTDKWIRWLIQQIWLNFNTAWEHLHGNHHAKPRSADISLGWSGGFDVWFFYIKKLGLAKIKKTYSATDI